MTEQGVEQAAAQTPAAEQTGTGTPAAGDENPAGAGAAGSDPAAGAARVDAAAGAAGNDSTAGAAGNDAGAGAAGVDAADAGAAEVAETGAATGNTDPGDQAGADPSDAAAAATSPATAPAAAAAPVAAPTSPATVRVAAPAAEDSWANFGPAPERVVGRPGRILRRIGRVLTHEWFLACLGGLALAMLMHWRSVLHPATTIPADIWDPTLQAWQLAWSGHALLSDPANLWNGNAFYPDKYSYVFSDTLFGYFPAGLFGNGPSAALVRYNVVFILLHALAFIGPYALVRQLGAGRTAAALAGAAFAYAPWRWGQAGHMHVLSNGGIVLALAMLARGHGYSFTRGFERGRTRVGWVIAGWCVAAWQVSLGFGIGLPFAYVLAAIAFVVGVRWLVRWLRGRPVPGRWVLAANAIGVAVFVGVGVFMALPYFAVAKLHPEAKRSVGELAVYSPTLTAFITAPAQSWMWGPAHDAARAAMPAPAETTLLPGFMLIGLAVAGLFFSVWRLRIRLWLLAATVVSVALALGTHFFGGTYGYLLLYDFAPGWQGIRTPGRLIIWTTLLLAVLAAGAVGSLVSRSYELAAERPPYRPSLLMRLGTLIPLLLVLVEGANKVDHPVVPSQPVAVRDAIGPMVVLPTDQLTDENIMLWSTTRFQPMINGGSGFYPDDQTAARDALKSFPDASSVELLHQLGVKTVVVLKDRVAGTDYAHAATPDPSARGLGLDWRDEGQAIIFTLG
ncbi:MAG: hypothetical protein E6F99_04150 [Actinobacteria bacterium]|nr:MAG: hypothetical protein E6F99_04150 [Actinomycetota bacterium]